MKVDMSARAISDRLRAASDSARASACDRGLQRRVPMDAGSVSTRLRSVVTLSEVSLETGWTASNSGPLASSSGPLASNSGPLASSSGGRVAKRRQATLEQMIAQGW